MCIEDIETCVSIEKLIESNLKRDFTLIISESHDIKPKLESKYNFKDINNFFSILKIAVEIKQIFEKDEDNRLDFKLH